LVKIYRPNVHPDFPHGGRYTPFLETQNIGDKLVVEGPFGRFDYDIGGNVRIGITKIN
jgi:predicted ferric reductase